MLLACSPVPVPMSLPAAHRRHPSAPAVVVQPTKVPGILSISKPPAPRQHHQHSHPRHLRTPKPKPTLPHGRSPHDESTQHRPSAEPALPQPPAPSDKPPRGRQSKAPKDKSATRSPSIHGHSRRNNVRQPSPPVHSSQEGGPTSSARSSPLRDSNPATNSFDPFIVSSDSDSDVNSRPVFPSNNGPAKLAAPPAKVPRRHHLVQPPATPSPTPRPVPVPGPKRPAHRSNLSRSAPNPQALPRMDRRRTSAGYAMDTDFPVCDDTTDVEDNSPPSTPSREFPDNSWKRLSADGPRTAPLSSFNPFSFVSTLDSTPSRTRHHHYRTPSEGVFNMSLDEDMSSTSDPSEEFKKLFGFPPKRFGSVGPSATRAGKDKAGFFASSVFQNSPSPDELPPPAF